MTLYSHALRLLLVRCAHPDNKLSGLPQLGAARIVEVTP